jgi:uncharacterized protein (TIGR00369 family)
MQGWIGGTLPAPPLHHLTGVRPTEAGEGTCTFVIPATRWLASPTGLVEGGVLVALADLALAGAVHTTTPAGTAIAPADITVKFIRPAPPDGRDLTATAKVVHRGRTIAVSEARVTNADGKLVCVAIGSAMVLAGRDMTAPIAPQEELSAEDV